MLSGRAWAANSGPTADSSRAWVKYLHVFLKAQPDGPIARLFFGPTGRAWAEKSGPMAGPSRAWVADFHVGLFTGPARNYAQV
jgi:hypothetical protein